MTQEEKELLLKDLCARLTYGVIVDYKENEYDFHIWKISTLYAPVYSKSGSLINTNSDGWIEYKEYEGCGMSTGSRPLHLEITLPFLRPMSSMTEEEKRELWNKQNNNSLLPRFKINDWYYSPCYIDIDFLNKNMFDYRGLIERGLALEAPKGMYRKETEK